LHDVSAHLEENNSRSASLGKISGKTARRNSNQASAPWQAGISPSIGSHVLTGSHDTSMLDPSPDRLPALREKLYASIRSTKTGTQEQGIKSLVGN
jgi:hypothetical protein